MKRLSKKTAAIILSIALVFQLCSGLFVTVQAKADIVNNSAMEIAILKEAGVIGNEEADKINDTMSVSRGAFAEYAAKAAKIAGIKDKVYFTDVPKDHWANEYVNALTEMGVIDRADDNMFNPGADITYEQAIKIMIVITGYKEYALTEADIMKGYVVAANKTGIGINVADTNKITLKEALNIIFNAMQIDVAMPVTSGDGIKYTVEKGENLLKLHNIYIDEGEVKALYGYNLKDAKEVEKNQVNINGEIFNSEKISNAEEAFGKTVDYAYIKKGKSTDKSTLIYLDSGEENFVIESNMITGFNGSNITYFENNEAEKAKTKSVSSESDIILNGKPYGGKLNDIIQKFVSEEKKGSIEFADRGRSTADLVIVRAYDVIVASGYDEKNEILTDYFNNKKAINLKDVDTKIIKDHDGKETTMPANYPTVMAVAFSEDREQAEVIVSTTAVNGTIDVLRTTDKEIECAGKKYKINDNAWNSFNSQIVPDASVQLYLDICGDVAYIVFGTGSSMKLGYLIEVATNDNIFEKDYLFKIFADGKVQVYNVADRVTLDGDNIKMTDTAKFVQNFYKMTLENGKIKVPPQIIRFNVNADGKINEIDTCTVGDLEDKDYTLTVNTTEASKPYWSTFNRIGMDIPYGTSNTTVFSVPKVDDNGEYMIYGESQKPVDTDYKLGFTFVNAISYNVESYNYNRDNQYTDIIVLKNEPAVDNKYNYMFDSVYESLNADGEVITKASLWTKEGKVEYEVHEGAVSGISALNQGDIIYINETLNGGILSFVKMFDVKTKIFTATSTSNDQSGNRYWYDGNFDLSNIWNYSKTHQLSKTYVYDIITDTVESCYEFSDLADGNVKQKDVLVSVPIFLYDSTAERGEKIRAVSLNEVKSYVKDGAAADMMLVSSRGELLRNVYIIR